MKSNLESRDKKLKYLGREYFSLRSRHGKAKNITNFFVKTSANFNAATRLGRMP